MKPPQFFITLILSAICVLLSLLTIWQGQSLTKANIEFETDKANTTKTIQEAQQEINRGNQAYNILTNMVSQIVLATDETKPGGAKDDKLKALLKDVEDNGFKINIPSPSPASATSPSATPKP